MRLVEDAGGNLCRRPGQEIGVHSAGSCRGQRQRALGERCFEIVNEVAVDLHSCHVQVALPLFALDTVGQCRGERSDTCTGVENTHCASRRFEHVGQQRRHLRRREELS